MSLLLPTPARASERTRETLVAPTAAPRRRLRVLLVAFACNPYRGSEDGVGWGWARRIARDHDTWVLTADFQRSDLERAATPPGLRLRYVPSRPWHYRPTRIWKAVERSFLKPLMNLSYVAWQRDALRVARRLHEQVGFDVVHLLTYTGFRFPGRFWRLGAPFVWGPVGGLENTPWRLLPLLGPKGAVYHALRNVVNAAQKRFLPGPRHAFRAARGGLVAASGAIRREIERWYGEASEVIAEVGPPALNGRPRARRREGEALRFAWSGEHLPGKALPLLLEALASLPPSVPWRLDVLGEGPCSRRWRRLARRLRIDERCVWHGWVPRTRALSLVGRAHVFVITSVKDLSSTVLLEALALGVPVIAPDLCGFRDILTEACGVRIGTQRPGGIVPALAEALCALERDEPRRRAMAAAAARRAQEFSWDAKMAALNRIYRRRAGVERRA